MLYPLLWLHAPFKGNEIRKQLLTELSFCRSEGGGQHTGKTRRQNKGGTAKEL